MKLLTLLLRKQGQPSQLVFIGDIAAVTSQVWWLDSSVRNLVPEELDLVPDLGFSSSVSSLDSLVPGLVPGLFFSSWISS